MPIVSDVEHEYVKENERLRAEVERLRAEVARLQAQLATLQTSR